MKTQSTIKAAIALASTVIVSTPLVVLANEYTDQIRTQLLGAALSLGFGNYSLSYDPYVDTLDSDRSEYLTVNLVSGTSYALVGVCDEDCQDLDLRLYDENNNLISSDTDSDDFPVVSVTPRWSGQYQLQATMYNCSTSYCYYGVGVFNR